MSRPLFTVVTVSYNRGHEIARTLDSVVGQRLRDFQFVVVDAVSKDDTPQILARYADRIDTLICEPDRGLWDGMNKGLRAAEGELVCFLNAGDEFASADVLAETAAAFRRHGEPDLLYGDVILEDVAGRRALTRYPNLSARFLYRKTVCHQTIFARRGLFAATGPFSLSFKYCADFDWLTKAVYSAGARAVRTGVPTAIFRLDGLTSREYVMHERFDVITRNMPLWLWPALGALDAATRLAGEAPAGKKIGRWLRRLAGGGGTS